MNEESKTQNDKKTSGRKKLYGSIAAVLVVVMLIAGFSYAWFYNKTDMATLMKITPPSNISILGPNGKEMTSLDLNYTAADKDASNKVTVRRVICVQSEQSVEHYKLEIVHTTNLKGLTFNLYPVSKSKSGTLVNDDGEYYFDAAKPVAGSYINLASTSSAGYKYADDAKHNQNYSDYTNVQTHAEPVYWLVNDNLSPDKDTNIQIEDKSYHRTYYVCEVTWTETTKETDIFYILAKTV